LQVKWGGGFSNPLSGGGDEFQAELVNGLGNPVIISFQKPKGWKVILCLGVWKRTSSSEHARESVLF